MYVFIKLVFVTVELFRTGRAWASKFKNIYHIQIFTLASVNIYNPEDIEVSFEK